MEPWVPLRVILHPTVKETVMTNAIEVATRRVLETYALMFDTAKAEEVREGVQEYLQKVFSAGETDEDRLAVCGLVYLREKEGRSDPVAQGFTGL
jgi:hypothetical protein